jgi:hypothetical protein
MFVSRSARRRIAAAVTGVVAAVGLGLVAAPSAAAWSDHSTDHSTRRTTTAAGNWQLTGSVSGQVGLQATKAKKRSGSTLSFFVTEQFCDTGRNQQVFRSFTADTRLPRGSFEVAPQLANARLAVWDVRVSGVEQRVNGCGSTNPPSNPIGLRTSTVSLIVTWQATGPVTPVQPGVITRTASAVGVARSEGPLDLGHLGPAVFAQLTQTTSSSGSTPATGRV